MDEMHAGYGKEVDLWVFPFVSSSYVSEFLILSLILAHLFGVEKLGVWSDPFHLTGRLATVLAPQTDADAEDDYGGSLSV